MTLSYGGSLDAPPSRAVGGGAAQILMFHRRRRFTPTAERWGSSAPPRRPIDSRRAPHRVVRPEATIFLGGDGGGARLAARQEQLRVDRRAPLAALLFVLL